MPRVNGNAWRHRRAQLGITSEEAAKILKMAEGGGSLRSIERGIKPASLALAYRAARLYSCGVGELLAEDGTPSQPPGKEQDPETNVGPSRDREGSGTHPGQGGKSGPKRVHGSAA